MYAIAWVFLFLAGIGLLSLIALIRFLFGGSRRAAEEWHNPRRRGGAVSFLGRMTFFIWGVTLFFASSAAVVFLRGERLLGCSQAANEPVACAGLPGADAIAWYLSMPGFLGEAARWLLGRLTGLVTEFGSASSDLVSNPAAAGIGLIGPLVTLLAWWGYWRLIGDVRRMWRGW